MRASLHLGVALDGAGWHPAAWRLPSARPGALFDPEAWVELVRILETAGIDYVTLEDSLTLQSANPFIADERTDQIRGRLDANLLASTIAASTDRIGLIPTITTTHTEPFSVSTRVATLDFVSRGRAGWRVQTLKQPEETESFGRRDLAPLGPIADVNALPEVVVELFDEAADSVEVVRRLWDSWEDDAEIRDVATGRFIDRDKLHYIDFVGQHFSVRGPSITPRPPQGQPVVAVLAHATIPYELAVRSADVVFITPHDDEHLADVIDEIRSLETQGGQRHAPLQIVVDLVVLIADDTASAASELTELDGLANSPLVSDARIIAGSANDIADVIESWSDRGIAGVRLRPVRSPLDVERISALLVPELSRRGVLSDVAASPDTPTLRERLGLTRPTNRYATSAATLEVVS